MSIRTVMITGATSGIGHSLTQAFLAQYDKVIACGRNREALDKIEQQDCIPCLFDVNNRQQMQQATSELPDIDILILNAGDCQYIDDAINFNAKIFEGIINTNLISTGYLLQCMLPKLKQGGQLVFISSSSTILPFPRNQAYGASKAGLDYLANSLRIDLASQNIDVTLVHPGFIETPLTDKNNFHMPFIISSEEAANRIIEGINKRKKYLHFPKRLTLILKLFHLLPNSWWQAITARSLNA